MPEEIIEWIEEPQPKADDAVGGTLKRPASVALTLALSLVMLVIPFGLPAAASAPTINGQNPDQTGPGPVISDLNDGQGTTYHFVARVTDTTTPAANITVTAEIDDADADLSPNFTVTLTNVAGTDTWHAFWDIPASPTTTAGSGIVTFTAVDDASASSTDVITVEIQPTRSTVEISRPSQGGTLNFFDYDGDGLPEAIVTGTVSAGIDTSEELELFYSISPAGTDPVWVDCEGNSVTITAGVFTGRCELASGDTPSDVTMIAARADLNDVGAEAGNDSGDAHRITGATGTVRLNAEPENATNPSNTNHTITMSTFDENNVPVSGTAVTATYEGAGGNDPDDLCTTNSAGTCTVVFQNDVNQSGRSTITAFVSGTAAAAEAPAGDPGNTNSTDVVLKQWSPSSANTLDCEPDSFSNPAGTQHTWICTIGGAQDDAGGTTISVEYAGANDPDGANAPPADDECVTGSGGTCTVTLGDNTEDTSSAGVTTMTATAGTANPDVNFKTWTFGALDCEPDTASNPVNTSHTWTCSLSGSGAGITIRMEYEGANDPDSGFTGTPDDECVTGAGGTCTVTIGPADETTTEAGDTTATAWVSGTTVDTTEDPGDDPDGNQTDVMIKTWLGETATALDCDPEFDTNTVGDAHEITCTGYDQFGNPASTGTVRVEYSGLNDPDNGYSPTSPDDTCVFFLGASESGFGTDPATSPPPDCSVWLGDEANEFTTSTGGFDPSVTPTTITAWIDADGNTNTVEADTTETVADETPTARDDTDVMLKWWRAGDAEFLDCIPETATNTTATGHRVTCTVTDEFGNPVSDTAIDGENLGGPNDPDNSAFGGNNNTPDYDDFCRTNTRGTCSAVVPYQGESGTADLCFWGDTDDNDDYSPLHPGKGEGQENDGDRCTNAEDAGAQNPEPIEGDLTDIVEKTWTVGTPPPTPGGLILDCEPESEENPAGEDHTVTCSVTDPSTEDGVSGVQIDGENIGGPNDPGRPHADYNFCETDVDGECTGTIPADDNEEGTAELCFWIDADDDNKFFINGGSPDGGDCEENQTATDDDDTDVVEKTWTSGEEPPPPPPTENVFLNCEPETEENPVGEAHTVTCTAVDDNNEPVNGITIDGETLSGANDPGLPGADHPEFCTTDENGECSGTVSADEGQAGTADLCFWIDFDGDNAFGADSEDGGDCDESASLDPTPDETADDDNSTDRVLKEWAGEGEEPPPSGLQLDCELESDSNPAGTDHPVTCTVLDENDEPVDDIEIDGENRDGANDPNVIGADYDPFCTTGSNGTCTGTVEGDDQGQVGAAELCFWIDSDNDSAFNLGGSTADGGGCDEEDAADDDDGNSTDIVTKTWTGEGPGPTPGPEDQGYWIFEENGGVHSRGAAGFFGSAHGSIGAGSVATDGDSTPSGNGYWVLESNGGVHARGDAGFFGSAHPFTPSGATGIAAHPSGCGYWIVENNGGIHARGCAGFFGNVHGVAASNAVAIAATPSGNGYWILESNGGIHARGDAGFFGAAHPFTPSGSTNLDNHSSGCGYWVVENNGGVHARGCAGFFGAAHPFTPSGATGLSATPDNGGYWISENNGGVHARGAALFFGGVHGLAASNVTDIEGLGS